MIIQLSTNMMIAGTAVISAVIGGLLVIFVQYLTRKNQTEELASESVDQKSTEEITKEEVVENSSDAEQSTEAITEEQVIENSSEKTVDQEVENLFSHHSWSESEIESTNYNTELYQKIAEDYNRMMKKIKDAELDNNIPSGTGFAPRLSDKSSTRRIRRVHGQVRYTGSVESPNLGEFGNQVLPKE